VVEAGEGDVVDARFGAPFEGLGDILGVALLVGADQQAVLFVAPLAVGEFLGDAFLVVRIEFAVVELVLGLARGLVPRDVDESCRGLVVSLGRF